MHACSSTATPTLPVGTFARRRVLSGARRCVQRSSARRYALAWAGDAIAPLPVVGRAMVLHVAGRLRVLLRVYCGDMNAKAVGAVEALAAMPAAHALELSWACGGGGAAFHIFQMLPQSALREAPLAVRAHRIPRILPRRHFLAAKNLRPRPCWAPSVAFWQPPGGIQRCQENTHHTYT